MTKTSPVELDQLNQFIDQAIDSLFVPRSARPPVPEAPPEIEAAPPAPEPPPPPPPSALETTEISWDQASAPSARELSDGEEDTPRHPALRPLHEAMLSLDWEINNETIATMERAIGEFKAQFARNSHVEAVTKLGLITCKYLKASKSVATPLAPRFLREMIRGCDLFLAGPAAGSPSPDARMNDLLGLYNEMKLDANRLRANEIKRREDRVEPPARPAAPVPTPAPAVSGVAPAPSGVAPASGALREGLNELWDLMEQIRGRLRGAAAQGAPYADSIDAVCARSQVRLQGLLDLAEQDAAPGAMGPLAQSAQDLSRALARFQDDLRIALKPRA